MKVQFQIANDDVTQITEDSNNITTISYAPNAIDPGNPNARPIDVVSDSVGLVLDRGYDLQGRLTSVANGAGGNPTIYVWNGGTPGSPTELASVTTPVGSTTTYGGPWGDHGHPAGATTGGSSVLTESYVYDSVGNLQRGPDTSSELAPGMGGVVSRTFDADRGIASVLLEKTLPNPPWLINETMTLEPRSDGRLRAIRPPYGGDTEFDYSPTGRVNARREKANGAWVTTSFGYDPLDRVSSTELANGMRSELGYDGAGRVRTITSKRSGVVEETLTRTFSAGRLTSSVDSAFTGSETYAYDFAGRVSTITYPGGEHRELGYD
ncbi:MAG: hypothetical protein L0206_04025, partial [Actinobacteria bacterium]|nr:hypothetical protein [Actinomycetota bacterium]